MKIVCNKSDLVSGVSIVSKAVSNKTTLPILECILMEASAGTITLTANDMELGIETNIKGNILEQGKSLWMPSYFLRSSENCRIMMLQSKPILITKQLSLVKKHVFILWDRKDQNSHIFRKLKKKKASLCLSLL